ncbi:AbrB/MazE/SpoVT family DNA-binding domain-containing protein [Leucobacter insecticola]|uniref:AbrB/MazE/SpoVT family DNA-binding domain-containing protein n=1 Tax=Leucobacter insecticola TaxID=2714934 RepID=A0A6G8FM75_9MICO|nr:AbrB/MazE/SpoVT family DNA-binding domain-containing protein [Leucobacter insecticola]
MSSKGQITIPQEIRRDLELDTGSQVMIIKVGAGQYRIMARNSSIEDLAGILYDPTRPTMSIEEMNEAIADGGAESGMRGMNPARLG